jgi:hypothetical protein
MDGQVNFYRWAYTTPANSTFSSMQIDRAGNYFIRKSDMAFGFTIRSTITIRVVSIPTRLGHLNQFPAIQYPSCAAYDPVSDPNGLAVMPGRHLILAATCISTMEPTPAHFPRRS